MENPIIKLEGLTKNYGQLKAVDQLSLEVNRGEIFGLLGPNGAGKTTTILMMLGLTDPSSGKVQVCGVNATQNPIEVKRRVGYMPDSVGFYSNMTALENLIYIGRLNGISDSEIRDRAEKTMDMVGLKGKMHQRTSTYSKGMKQRLGLADVLIREPEVVILDEPTLGIDPKGISDFLSLIRHLSRENGLTVLLSSHHLHQVQQVCDRIGIFVKGKLLVQGKIEDLAKRLFNQEAYRITVESATAIPPDWSAGKELGSKEGVLQVEIKDKFVEISLKTDTTPEIVRFLVQKGMEINGVRKKEFGLDEIYHRYFEDVSEEDAPSIKQDNSLFKSLFKRSNN